MCANNNDTHERLSAQITTTYSSPISVSSENYDKN